MAVAEAGWHVEVIAAHPHYPDPRWGKTAKPYWEVRDGIRVLRLPLWIGRDSGMQRIRQEASFAASLAAAAPFVGKPDVVVAVSPCFPSLAPTVLNCRARRVPLLLWLQDLVVDGAATTGLLNPNSKAVRASRWLEDVAYREAQSLVVISDNFRRRVLERGVDPDRVHRIYNPATRPVQQRVVTKPVKPYLLSMGNIGHSQGLDAIVRAFESSDALAARGFNFVITGHGMAAEDVRAARTTDRVHMPGIVTTDELDGLLAGASLGVVSQRDDIDEFNLPSKLMNFMAEGVPVLASVRPGSEVADLVKRAGAGWVVPTGDDAAFEIAVREALDDPQELDRRGVAGHLYAQREFTPRACADAFVALMERAVATGAHR
jgi:colanic acid biosynthesis glycosyl transferase WcaI